MRKWHKKAWLLVALFAALATGCDFPGQPKPADRPVRADQIADFDQLYSNHCAGCHGADGKLGAAPPLNDPIFLAIVPDDELQHVIAEGRSVTLSQRSPMPAFLVEKGGPLTGDQVKVLAQGIKKRWAPSSVETKSLPSYLLPAEMNGACCDDTQLERGKKVFTEACAGCHGSHGQGGVKGHEHAGANSDPAFLALISDQALRRIIITGRPDLGMPTFDGQKGRPTDFHPLSSANIDDLTALLAHWRQSPPGKDD
ncbi:MAG TPA: c-type cytochrome [Gemmataceae bacterium]|jgi:mono/diheme cytochrome c family protein|nr:c-type cytochrome [Gemmataceae bacterium]